MQTNAGFFEEKKLDQSHDIKLLWQLYPYVRPYRLMLFFSIVMAMVITLMDLSLPYITKIAIDRYIVPKTGIETPHFAPARYLTVDIAGKDVADIVRRYPEHFVVSGSSVVIAYNQLEKLAPQRSSDPSETGHFRDYPCLPPSFWASLSWIFFSIFPSRLSWNIPARKSCTIFE